MNSSKRSNSSKQGSRKSLSKRNTFNPLKWNSSKWFVVSIISLFTALTLYTVSAYICSALLVSSELYLTLTLPFFIALIISFCAFAVSGDFILQGKKEKIKINENLPEADEPITTTITVVDNIIYIADNVA